MKRLAAVVVLAVVGLAILSAPAPAASTKVTLRDSPFGQMLWGPGRQALYMFENDRRDKSRCYGFCAREWPPLLAKGTVRAGSGLDPDLLGTTRRRNGKRQVTYGGRPLYAYAHEGPGQVFCHDIRLNGGYWWALGADGERLP